MLQPISQDNANHAIQLLATGFPNRSHDYWAAALSAIDCFGGNRAAQVPAGYLWMDRSNPTGVMLTPASMRSQSDGTAQRIVNLASWYVEPAARWKAPLMLRSVMQQHEAVYTDLSPTEPVQKMLTAFGFKQVTRGVSLNLLAVEAITGRTSSRVQDLGAVPAGAIKRETRDLLLQHRPFNCAAAAFKDGDSWCAMLFKLRRVRGVPAAVLAYCESNAAFYRNLGHIARYLLRKGRLVLVVDVPLTSNATGFLQTEKHTKFVRGTVTADVTDHAGSELVLFGV